MSRKYTVEYFIQKFKTIPEDRWYEGSLYDKESDSSCALGHCGMTSFNHTTQEAVELAMTLGTTVEGVADINDGHYDVGNTPKERILAALYRKKQLGESKHD